MSPELETLDQLLGGDMSVSAIVAIYPSPDDCRSGLLGLLAAGDVRLLTPERLEAAEYEWRALFSQQDWIQALNDYRLSITQEGTSKIE